MPDRVRLVMRGPVAANRKMLAAVAVATLAVAAQADKVLAAQIAKAPVVHNSHNILRPHQHVSSWAAAVARVTVTIPARLI